MFYFVVVIGDDNNQRSHVRHVKTNTKFFDTSTPDILHCNEFRTFWMKWYWTFSGTTRAYFDVGKGPLPGEHMFMSYNDAATENYDAVGLTSSAGNSAVWRINENSGRSVSSRVPCERWLSFDIATDR